MNICVILERVGSKRMPGKIALFMQIQELL
jgi:hypothetical protein